tara:strand:+ start:186 stop:791 length:606 start_codon:yes stop_codon:yes gene_type:complete
MARTKNNRSGLAYKMRGFPKHATTSPLHNNDESWLEWGKRKFQEGKQKLKDISGWENLPLERQEQFARLLKSGTPIGMIQNQIDDLKLLGGEAKKVIKGDQTFQEGKDNVLDHTQKHMELPGIINPVIGLGDAAISKARGEDEEAKKKTNEAIIGKITKPIKAINYGFKALKTKTLADKDIEKNPKLSVTGDLDDPDDDTT